MFDPAINMANFNDIAGVSVLVAKYQQTTPVIKSVKVKKHKKLRYKRHHKR